MFNFVSNCKETPAHFSGDRLEKNSYIGINMV